MLPMLSTFIPPEIQNTIIEQCQSDPSLLSLCSLVSKQWLACARCWIFAACQARLAVHCDEKQGTTRLITLLLTPGSTLAPYIQNVIVEGPNLHHRATSGFDLQAEYELLNTLIIDYLSRMQGIRIIQLSAFPWDHLLPQAQAVISSLPCVTSIILKDMTFRRVSDLWLLSRTRFSGLEALKLWRVTMEEHSFSTCNVGRMSIFPRLRFLDIVLDDKPCLLLSPSSAYINPEIIDTLCLGNVSMNDVALVNIFIMATGPALRHLALDIAQSATEAAISTIAVHPFPISLHQNTSLQTLEISTLLLHPLKRRRTSQWLYDMLSTVTSPKLTTLNLWFTTRPKWSPGMFDFPPLERCLLQLKDTDSGADDHLLLSALATVRLNFLHTYPWDEDDHTFLAEQLRAHLPILHERGMIDVLFR
ncbi:hypothetical protein Hypma_013114 [Hypsizygus marmoreus]|uniref:F-box domain-containing protein n=1 Tax=Hypsizygus marmoreus TaxID=39966 RepID=A0A369JHI8_HYPMA|nr:hypothetical protein Hypma_013114 [Hypsizygus marmoreus]